MRGSSEEGIAGGELEEDPLEERLITLLWDGRAQTYNNAHSTPILIARWACTWDMRGIPGNRLSQMMVVGVGMPSIKKKVATLESNQG